MKNYQLPPQHYLDIARKAKHLYYDDFLSAFDSLFNILSSRQQRLLKQKLQLVGANQFNEGKFVQIACETAVCAYFAKEYPENFRYEHKVNRTNQKDVDCQFTDGKYTYNVEVKCPGLENYRKVKDTGPKIELIGRFEPEGRELANTLMAILNNGLQGEQKSREYNLNKSLDNTLKTFLQEAHEKFPALELTDMVNILVVCCDGMDDVQRWIHYLFQRKGLFTEEAFIDCSTYSKVDIVLLTNLLNRHYLFDGKSITGDSWNLKHSFNLAFDNPLKKGFKINALLNFLYKFPHYSYFLEDYLNEDEHKDINERNLGRALVIRQFVPEIENLLSKIEGSRVNFFA